MMNRYSKRFAELRTSGKKSFIPFTLLGWPDRTAIAGDNPLHDRLESDSPGAWYRLQ